MLVVERLRRAFGDLLAVEDVSFTVDDGETFGLLGPNGAGKTTTISMVVGLLAADDGHVELDGDRVLPGAREVQRRIGYVPQELAVYPDLTGRENLDVFARLHDLSDRRDRVAEVLEITGLAERADDRADEYSGGMKRRLNIGIGLLHRPRLLILDEPTVGVDPQSRDAILDAVERLSDGGVSVLYTTHYMEEAERLCDRVGIIDHGRLVASGSHRELTARVGERDVVRLVLDGDRGSAAAALTAVVGVETAVVTEDGVDVTVSDARGSLARLLAAVPSEVDVTGVTVDEPDLEAVFLHLTGRALRD